LTEGFQDYKIQVLRRTLAAKPCPLQAMHPDRQFEPPRAAAAAVPFRGFDPYGEVRFYDHGLLPHWRQPGATYFVTFRLADAIPRSVLEDWKAERNDWLRSHGIDPESDCWSESLRALRPAEVFEFERRFGERLDHFLDAGHGSCLLRDRETAVVVENSLRHFHGKRVLLGDYVVMPNHVHSVMRPMPGFDLESLLHSVKSYTAHLINEINDRSGTVWQKESYDRIVRDRIELLAFQEYIHANPANARLREGHFRTSERVVYEFE